MKKNKDKYFLSHKFTGLKYEDINKDLSYIRDELFPSNSEYFCSLWMQEFFEKNNMSEDDIYKYCLEEQEKSNIFIAYITSDKMSKGMQLELDKAVELKQKIILIIKQDLIRDKKFSKFINNFDEIYSFTEDISEIKKL
ncbi:MAG: hypothetical protein N4A38_00670 [Candidatus Gracilibacteria bacterium]|nr:hypothetical protein [Candidatus Gracilibacteria bacterium]